MLRFSYDMTEMLHIAIARGWSAPSIPGRDAGLTQAVIRSEARKRQDAIKMGLSLFRYNALDAMLVT